MELATRETMTISITPEVAHRVHRLQGFISDWNTNLGTGNAGTVTATIATPVPGTNITGGTSKITIDGQAFTASAPTAETAIITFGGTQPANTSSITIGTVTYTFNTTAGVTVQLRQTGWRD